MGRLETLLVLKTTLKGAEVGEGGRGREGGGEETENLLNMIVVESLFHHG